MVGHVPEVRECHSREGFGLDASVREPCSHNHGRHATSVELMRFKIRRRSPVLLKAALLLPPVAAHTFDRESDSMTV